MATSPISTSTSERLPDGNVVLQARSLQFGHRGRALCPPLDLTIRRGEFWALMGRNGAGKTTLLRTLVGLLPPISGQVLRPRTANVAYVAQRADLDMDLPMRVVDLVRDGCQRGWSFTSLPYWQRSRAMAKRAMAAMDCLQWRHRQYATLSEGQKQRVLLARALVLAPDVLILDEPTSAMDIVHEAAIFDLLDQCKARDNLALVVVNHRQERFVGRATHAVFVDRQHDVHLHVDRFEAVVAHDHFVGCYGNLAQSASLASADRNAVLNPAP